MEHLSPAWIAAFDDVVRQHDALRAATADRRLVIQFTVSSRTLRDADDDARTGAPPVAETGAAGGPDAVYAVVLDHGENRVVVGPHPDPDLTLRTDRATAAAIASHTESAQTAFMAGRLRLGGDVRMLIANQDVLAEIDDCARVLREQTRFAAAPGGATDA